MNTWIPTATVSLIIGFLLSACAGNSAPPPAPIDSSPQFVDEYRIGLGDTLSVSVWRNDDLSVIVPVRPDGRITVPVAGDVEVGGLTPSAVADTITEALKEYVRDPIVTVIVTNMGSSEFLTRVRVTGAVGGARSLPYRPGMTVLDVVLEAGGVTEFGNAARTVLYRNSGETLKIRLDRILDKGDMSTNFEVLPGDVVSIPERLF